MQNRKMDIAETKSFDFDCNVYGLSTYIFEGKTYLLIGTSYYLYLAVNKGISGHLDFEKIDVLNSDSLAIHSICAFSSKNTAFYWVLGIISLPNQTGSYISFICNKMHYSAYEIHIAYLPLTIKHVKIKFFIQTD